MNKEDKNQKKQIENRLGRKLTNDQYYAFMSMAKNIFNKQKEQFKNDLERNDNNE